MKHTITVPESSDITIDLWGVIYAAHPPTKRLVKKTEPLIERITDAVDEDELVRFLGDFFDAKLTAVDRRSPRPSRLIRQKWDADEITILQLMGVLQRLRDAETPM